MPKHEDFEKIYRNFIKQYGEKKGTSYYYAWLKKNGLDDTKPYDVDEQYVLAESFHWAKPSIKFFKADTDAKWYMLRSSTANISMNDNDYSNTQLMWERAASLSWRPLDMNHIRGELKLGRGRVASEGTLPFPEARVHFAKFEDNAVESLIRIPNTLPLVQEKLAWTETGANPRIGDITHPSIEGFPLEGYGRMEDGVFKPEMYTYVGLGLLEKGHRLPGDPLTTIDPLTESVQRWVAPITEAMGHQLVESLHVTLTLTDERGEETMSTDAKAETEKKKTIEEGAQPIASSIQGGPQTVPPSGIRMPSEPPRPGVKWDEVKGEWVDDELPGDPLITVRRTAGPEQTLHNVVLEDTELDGSIATYIKRLTDFKILQADQQREINRLADLVADRDWQIKELARKLDAGKESLETQKQRLAEQEQLIERLSTKIQSQEKQITEQAKQIDEHLEQIRTQSYRLEETKGSVKKHEETELAYLKETEDLRSQCNQYKQKLTDALNDVEARSHVIERQKAEVEKLSTDLSHEHQRAETLKRNFNEVQRSLNEENTKRKQADDDLAQKTRDMREMQEDIVGYTQDVTRLSNELDTVKTKWVDQAKENKALNDRILVLEAKNKELSEKVRFAEKQAKRIVVKL